MNTVKTILLLSIMGSFFGYTHGSDQITSVMNFLSGAANFLTKIAESDAGRMYAKMNGFMVPLSEADIAKLNGPLDVAVYLGTEVLPYINPPKQEVEKNIEKIQQLEEKRKREFIEAKALYEECLKRNLKGKRRLSSGIPFACKDAACRLAVNGGEIELQQLTKRFNEINKTGE